MALRQRGRKGRSASVTMFVVIICNCTWQACEERTDTNAMMKMGRETLVLDIGDMAGVG